MRRCCLRALVCWALLVSASATPLKYLSYYTFDFFKHGANITALGSANIAPPLNDDPVAAAIFRDLHGLPSMITPGGPLRLDRKPPSRGSWFHCGCATNSTYPQSCFADGWQDAFLEQAQQLVPFVENGTVVGIFFGDEISCSCNVPFVVFDEASSFFRGALSQALGPASRDNVFYATNECFSAMACPPPPAPSPFPQCTLAYNSTPVFDGYWPTIPPALDYISIDAYVGDGLFEPTWIRQFYEKFIYPKLQPHQNVWVVPGLTGPLNDSVAHAPPYLNDTLFLEKIQGYYDWALQDERLVGFLPWHWESFPPPPGAPLPKYSYGADCLPQTLQFLKSVAPPKLNASRFIDKNA